MSTTSIFDPSVEPLLTGENDRFSLRPFRYPAIYDFYIKAQQGFWVAKEPDMRQDKSDLVNELDDAERHCIYGIFAFFNPSDGIVTENAVVGFYNAIKIPEFRLYYGHQIAIEGVHQDVYSSIIDCLIPDEELRSQLQNSINNLLCVRKKADWMLRWMENGSFLEKLFAFAIAEGVFFSSSFCVIFWLKKRGLMPGVTFSNDLISRDENQHCVFAAIMYLHLVQQLSNETMHEIMQTAVECECEYVDYLMPQPLKGINAESMKQYVMFCADRVLQMFNCTPLYKATNPYEWMEMLGIGGKTSIFEKQVADYIKMPVNNSSDELDFTIDDL